MGNSYRKLFVFLCLISFTSIVWSQTSFNSFTQQHRLGINNWQVGIGRVVLAEFNDASRLVRKGLVSYQDGDITAAIKQWESALIIFQRNNSSEKAIIVRENLARAYHETRQGERAIDYWKRIIAYYRQTKNLRKVGRSLTELAQVYSSMGQPKEALILLCNPDNQINCSNQSAVQIAASVKDSIGKAAALGSLGDVNRLMGNYEKSSAYLQESLAIVEKINNPELYSSLLNSLGNTHISLAKENYRFWESVKARERSETDEAKRFKVKAKQEDAIALKYLHQSSDIARKQNDSQSQMRSLLRIIPIYYRRESTVKAKNSLDKATNLLESLPDSRSKVYAAIDLVNLMHLLQTPKNKSHQSRWDCVGRKSYPQEIPLLNKAIKVAKKIEDYRAESFALGTLGHIYECRQQYPQALKITKEAILAAEQELKAQDSLYLWEWQIGRIWKSKKEINKAILAYEQATKTLNTIRQDILTANRDIQFDFRDTIEPIYRELVALRLSLEESVQAVNKSLISQTRQENISRILKTIDSLKLAELQNYFGNDCIITPFQEKTIQEIGDTKTAYLNTIILSNKTVVILTLPNGRSRLETIDIKKQEIENKINEFRNNLESSRHRDDEYNTKYAREFYNWLVKPFIEEIQKSNIKTLVFIQDGILRSIPMAALHDGEKFLIQNYAVATIPSINLTDIRPLQKKKLRILALGLSKESKVNAKIFDSLKGVSEEINQILETIPGQKLIDEDFTISGLQKELNEESYPIIHIATHGSFGTQQEDTFIITGEKNPQTGENKILNFNDLDKKIRQNTRNRRILELLTLTACKTAVGDERSTLGLAGVAVQAGAKSTIASLWAIDDISTAQIAVDFYSYLSKNPNMTKAEALQAAQVELIEGKEIEGRTFTHPAYWSPLILVGNWQ
jgi:CHAT domain-containing protein